MRWLLPVGVLLIVIGLGGGIGACYQASVNRDVLAAGAPESLAGGVPAEQAADPPRTPLVMALLSGLALALGTGMVIVGMGHWRRPIPSDARPANPWSDQPVDKGDPPIGLV